MEIDFVKGCSNLVSNKVIAKELWDNLVELGAPEYTEEEMKFAKAISEGVGDSRFESLEKIAKSCKDKAAKAEVLSHKGESMYRFVAPFNPDGIMSFGSTDVGDVSWNCPTAQAYVATWAAGNTGPLLAGRFPGQERTGTQGTDLRGKGNGRRSDRYV